MPESSGDTPKPPPEPTGKNLTVAPRANPPSVFNQKNAAPAGLPTGAAEFMEWMKTFAGGPAAAEEPAPTGRTLIPKEQKKFSRQAADHGKSSPGADGSAPSNRSASGDGTLADAPVGNVDAGSVEPPNRSAPPELTAVERRRRPKEQPPKNPAVVLVTQFLAFGLIVGSFFLGRATVSKQSGSAAAAREPGTVAAAPDPGTPVILPADLAAKVDQANAEEKDGNYVRARALLDEIRQAGGRAEGLDYHLALLAYEAGDESAAITRLNVAMTHAGEAADAHNLRGIMMERAAGLGKGLPDLELAAQAAPFNARYAFFVGEILRRMGKPQAAQGYLTQAVHRLREPALQETYEAKLRLAQLETGQGQAFADELAAKLSLDAPPVDWLFTAAAVELHRGNPAAAARYLDKAGSTTSREEMAARLRDYYFSSFANDKELARFFRPIDPPAPASVPLAVPGTSPVPAAAPGVQGKAP